MRTLRFIAVLIAAVLCMARPAAAADAAAHQPDQAAIRQVVQQFQSAIVAKDGKALAALFLANHNSWLTVLDENTYREAKARNPAVPRVHPGTWKEFVDYVATAKKPIEERFYNVRIETNGAVASVYFDFDFLDDGAVVNRGSETWQMVHSEDGWKIGAMLFSIGR